MRRSFFVLAILVGACGDSKDDPLDPVTLGPPTIVVITATVRKLSLESETLTVSMENRGDAGSFKIQAWGGRAPNVPNAPAVMMAETEAAAVAAGWKETVPYVLTTNRSSIQTEYIVVLSSNPGSVTYRETDRVTPTRQ